ncbi:sugar phosphate nucleotidyltransferase [Opitutus sp. ER46]|uniref:mannose-1-phosphate guanylyltransferase n=1 Tax=Opitutus sp. ER46 TaxID=2161864 RepID=UPI000D31148E|nr:sugar phosphate nucleotidyltransferase [Opitutus sp. ER46]PTY00512.1 mannose-1-phosphate guanyltransferase [Opitutus sp. ER46]
MSDVPQSFACIMAGGSGERFWPMSRARRPKHLLKLFTDRTLLEETVRRIEAAVPRSNIFVLTNELQAAATREALRDLLPAEQIVAEPAKRDTAPAAALATALVRARGGENAALALLPADAFIADAAAFGRQLAVALPRAARTGAILTIGIKPDHAATGFGYLELGDEVTGGPGGVVRAVRRFVEKPDAATAQRYLESGQFVWNAGMFFWRVGTFLAEADRSAPELAAFVREFPTERAGAAAFLAARFPVLPKISVDYAIMEKARTVETMLAEFDWDDVGLWTALPKHLARDEGGNATRGTVLSADASGNIALSNGRIIALVGVSDLVVVETPDAVLVCHRDAVQDIKKITGQLPKELL